jgi:adenylate kinase
LLLLAPPGAGKGTQGERLAAWSGAEHIAAGDLLRAEAASGSELAREIAAYQARGDLVPDQIVIDALLPAVEAAAARNGFILDGFPRNLPQAMAAADIAAKHGFTLQAAVYLNAPESVLLERLLARASGGRSDDTAEVIRHRFQVFAETTGALVPYYEERGILVTVNADQPPDAVTAEIESRLAGLLGAVDHAPVDGDERRLLIVAQPLVGRDRGLGPLVAAGLSGVRGRGVRSSGPGHRVDQARLRQQGLGGQVEPVRDRLEHAHRRLVQAALDLAQIRVGQAGPLGQLAQRQVGQLALRADEGAECLPLRLPRVRHDRRLPPMCRLV